MPTFFINKDVFHIFAAILDEDISSDPAGTPWFDEDLEFITPEDEASGATIVIDFSYTLPAVVEYTLVGKDMNKWIAFNNGAEVAGGQSRYIRIRSGDKLNLRAPTVQAIINRCIVGEI